MKSCIIIFEDGFEEIEALSIVDVLRRAGLKCDMCSAQNDKFIVTGSHNVQVKTDFSIDTVNFNQYDCIIIPGGPAANKLKLNKLIIKEIKEFNSMGKLVCAICAAPIVLAAADIIKDKKITSYPGYEDELKGSKYIIEDVAEDQNIITSRGPATALAFSYKIVEELCGKNKSDELKNGMLYK